MLSKLKWDLSAITPHDFLNQIISRLPKSMIEIIDVAMISRHAKTFIAFCAKGWYLFFYISQCKLLLHWWSFNSIKPVISFTKNPSRYSRF